MRKFRKKISIPENWKKGHLMKIPKKRNLADCSNYRGTTMLSVPRKIHRRIILQICHSNITNEGHVAKGFWVQFPLEAQQHLFTKTFFPISAVLL